MDINNIKIPPNSIDSEKSVLGALLLQNDSWDKISDTLYPQDFYHAQNKNIYDAICELLKHNKPADILTVKEQIIKVNGDSDDLFAYLAEIVENTPNASNIQTYSKHVKELSIYRKLIKTGVEITESAYRRKNIDIEELLDISERKIFEITDQILRNKQDIINVKDVIKDVVNRAHEMQDKDGLMGLETGFKGLDEITSGFQKADLVIIAGRPGMGKTSIAMNIGEHVAIQNSIPIAVFSLEMPVEQLITRIICSLGDINSDHLRKGKMTESDWNSFNQAVKSLEHSNILIDETPSITPTEIRAKCRRIKRKYPDLGLIIIDYLQLMTVYGKSENRVQEISEISRSLKALAKELNLPVIAISQLNRSVESRPPKNKGRMPQMSDLRESGSIEQDADIICFVYRDEYYHDDNYKNSDEIGKADIKIAKHRNGAIGKIQLEFIKECSKFENYIDKNYHAYVTQEDIDATDKHHNLSESDI